MVFRVHFIQLHITFGKHFAPFILLSPCAWLQFISNATKEVQLYLQIFCSFFVFYFQSIVAFRDMRHWFHCIQWIKCCDLTSDFLPYFFILCWGSISAECPFSSSTLLIKRGNHLNILTWKGSVKENNVYYSVIRSFSQMRRKTISLSLSIFLFPTKIFFPHLWLVVFILICRRLYIALMYKS